MALTSTSTIDDIKAYIVGIIKGIRSDANVAEGSQLHDIIVESFAQAIYNERQSVNVAQNIAQVLPLFSSEGNLLYPDLKDQLLDRFFLEVTEETRIKNTVLLYFSRPATFSVNPGASLTYQGNILELVQNWYLDSDTNWKQDAEGYYLPVEIYVDDAVTPTQIPATDLWGTGALLITLYTSDASFIKARSQSAINVVSTPVLTLDTVQNGVSNRSLSNARSIRFRLRTDSGFHSENLKKSNILRYMDSYFIDTYRNVGYDSFTGRNTIVKSSGAARIMLDYGNFLQIMPIQLQYIPSGTDFRFIHGGFFSAGDATNFVKQIYLANVGSANTDAAMTGRLHLEVTTTYTSSGGYMKKFMTINLYRHTGFVYERVAYTAADIDITEVRSGYCELTEDNSSTLYGGMYFEYTSDIALSDTMYIQNLNAVSYYADIPFDAGVLVPAAVICLDDLSAAQSIATAYRDAIAAGSEPVPAHSSALVLLEGSNMNILGDDLGCMSKIAVFDPMPGAEMKFNLYDNNTRLYWKYEKVTVPSSYIKVTISLDETFTDATKIIAEKTVTVGTYTQTVTLVSRNNYSNTLDLTFSQAAYGDMPVGTDIGYIEPASSISGFSNNRLFISTTVMQGYAQRYHKRTAYLVYYGTTPEYLRESQSIFDNRFANEVSSKVNVSAFRPVSMTPFYHADYVFPYLPVKTSYATPEEEAEVTLNLNRFNDLCLQLENYFSNYSGDVTAINFSSLSRDIYNQTGMFLKRLDYTLATQRGYLVRGHIDISLTSTSMFFMSNVSDFLETQVAVYGPSVDDNALIDTRESSINPSGLFKPVFSKVRL